MRLYGISQYKLNQAITLVQNNENRPIHASTGNRPDPKRSTAHAWIDRYLADHGDELPNRNAIVLKTHETKKSLWEQYISDLEAEGEEIPCAQTFRNALNKGFSRLKFKHRSTLTHCDTCEKLSLKHRLASTRQEKLEAKKEYKQHKERQLGERRMYQARKLESRRYGTDIFSIAMDGTDGLRLPNFAREPKSLSRIPRFDLHAIGTYMIYI